jgi:serine/threonine-protein kinase
VFQRGILGNDVSFFAMELIHGQSLGAVIKNGELPEMSLRIRWLQELARAVAYVHSKGFLYCDLKPDNVIIRSSPAEGSLITLLDFGITVPIREGLKASDLDARGTTEYMSPEQHAGKKLGFCSDVYSFGVLAFELLTGERPFQVEKSLGSDMSRAMKYSAMHTIGKIPYPRALNPSVPKDVSAIVEVCLQKDDADRFESMGDVYERFSSADGCGVLKRILSKFGSGFYAK